MPFRRTSRRIVRPRKRALWVNIPFGGVNYTESSGSQLLMSPEDWEAQFSGTQNETAVLRAVVGDLVLQQTVVGTAGGNMFWGIYIADTNATVVPAFTTATMGEVDWLLTGARATTASITSSVLQSTQLSTIPVRIKSKRKLKSRDAIYFTAQFASDAASPAGIASGLLRFLVARD